MKWFALCEGEGLKLCETCKRLADKWPEDAKDRAQPRIAPAVDSECCGHWLADWDVMQEFNCCYASALKHRRKIADIIGRRARA